MHIVIDSLIEGARRSRGTTVVVDVFRAFTTAAVAFSRGAERILLTSEPEEALALRERGAGHLCMGEVGGKRPPGFDFGNSPFELSRADVRGKTLVQSTRAGTVGVCAVPVGQQVYAASLAVASATADVLRHDRPDLVTLVAMGKEGRMRTDEDEVCALYIRNLLQGRQTDRHALVAMILAGEEASKYGDPAQPHFHREDREWALDVDAFDFAIRIAREGEWVVATPRRLEGVPR